jgi:RNA polymerase sigma factor (sigma-70 family)
MAEPSVGVGGTAGAEPPGVMAEHYFRREYGRLVGTLARGFGVHRLAAIEDAVQSALLTALTSWGLAGVPREPGAWLLHVARNRLLDDLRREKTTERVFARDSAASDHALSEAAPSFVDEISDNLLRMLFVCSDESLPRESQIVLALKVLCGFGTREIALRLMTTEANVHKRLARGREKLAVLWIDARVDTPPREALARRLDSVLQTIYLMFTSGYSSAEPDQLVRRDLCEEALRLAHLLAKHPVGDQPATWALLALMSMQAARLATRVDDEGGLLLLEQQDRSRWDRRLIEQGLEFLTRSAKGDEFTRYHAEAAVLAEHCLAPSYAETRWDEIASLYEMLERLSPSPIHTLNRAIAVAEARGPEAGLTILRELSPPSWLLKYYLWDATVGELERRAGHFDRAVAALSRALEGAPTGAERALIRRRLDAARDRKLLG